MDQQRMIGKRGRRPIGVTSLSFVCIATLIGVPAFAQDARSNVDQIGSSRSAGAQGVKQLSHRSREVQGSAAPAEGHLTAPQQLSTGDAKNPVAPKLTREGKQAGAPVQRSEEHTSELRSLMRT